MGSLAFCCYGVRCATARTSDIPDALFIFLFLVVKHSDSFGHSVLLLSCLVKSWLVQSDRNQSRQTIRLPQFIFCRWGE